MAKEAGLEMTESHLLPASKGAGFFATKRFDRDDNKKLHMHTASGLLHSDFRTPSLDYEDLLALTEVLTKDVREVEKMFRLSVFNILSHTIETIMEKTSLSSWIALVSGNLHQLMI